ncbi:MAG TPA: Ppx/GppA family phosphatase, partial [Roseiflexaceae bacterium]|nr:Ppx/GppA family phosphatase [Roseiflexaceae bacterium]
KEFKALEQAVAECFADMDWLQEGHGLMLAGVGGTIRALGKIDQKARNYSFDRIHAYTFTRERLDDMVEMLRGMTLAERERVPGLNADRADLVLPGALIVRQVMRQGGFEELTVSGQGVREGLFYEHFLVGETPPLLLDMRGFSVQNLARVYNYETIHAAKVRELALALFDQTASLHGYGPWERELLGYAATIHDIGVAVGYYDHHKHGEYLVLNASLQGFSHREIVLLALLVRYHRKGNVSVKAYSDILNASDEQRVARLASLLRIAEYLERRKSQVVQGLHVEIGDTVRVVTQADDDASVEIWDANRRSDLFAQAFGRAIEIV